MIMKPWKTAAALLAAALAPALGLTSCGDTETEWVTAPTVSASQAVVTAPDEGGTVTVGLTITNPAEGATVSASPSASWVEVTSCTETALALSVPENPNSDPRTARVTVSYSYSVAGSRGSCSCEVTVAQSCGDQPAISVQPTAVAAAVEGGSYSFNYTIVNPASDGEVSASCTASWISGIDASKDGEVGFGVEENTTTALRQAEITLSYSWANGSLSESVTVVQDHQGGSGNDDGDDGDGGFDGDIEGTYTMTGVCYESYPYSTSWTVTIHYDPGSQYTDSENPYLIDGLIYAEIGDYPYYAAYCAKARVEGSSIVVPAQITEEGFYYLDETYTTGAYLGYVAGYIDGDGYLNAYDNRPDMVFTYDEAGGSWSCNYGIMGFLYDTPGDFSSESGYFIDFTVGDITLTKSGSGGGGGGDGEGMTGTYSCSGYGRISGGYGNATWDMYITEVSGTYYAYCLTPYAGGLDIADAGTEYWATVSFGSNGQIIIPSQVCRGQVNSSSGATYYWGYTPCTEYDGSSWYYSNQYPAQTFTSTGGDTWESDYGMFAAGCTGYDITTFESYFGVTAPTVKATKTSDTVPTAIRAAAASGGSLSAETFSNLKASSAPVPSSGRGIRAKKAGARAAR